MTLDGVAAVTFSPGSFASAQAIKLEKTSDPDTAALFAARGPLYDVGARAPYEVRIDTGTARPAAAVHVDLDVPAGFALAAGERPQVFVEAVHAGDLDAIDGFDWVPSTLDAAGKHVTLDLAPGFFGNSGSPAGSGVVLLLAAAGEIADSSFATALRPPGCPKGVRSIRAPREPLQVKSPFDPNRDNSKVNLPPGHLAVDLIAADGDEVVATGDGTVAVADESNGKSGAADNHGCGGTIIVKIPDVGSVGYCHLKSGSLAVKPGDTVKAGQKIAESDNTGASTGAHLHLTYVPKGYTPIDPMLCVDLGYDGPVSVHQTGPIKYDATGSAHLRLKLDDRAASFYEISGTVSISGYETSSSTCTFSPSQGSLGPYGTTALQIYKKTLAQTPYNFADDSYELSYLTTWSAMMTCTDKTSGKVTGPVPAAASVGTMMAQPPSCVPYDKQPLTDRDHIVGQYSTTCLGGTTASTWDLQALKPVP